MINLRTLAPVMLFCLAPLASQAALTPYTEAVKKADEEKKYMVVIWNGSDWSPQANETAKEFETFSSSQTLPVIWCEWDEREHVTDEEKESDFFNKNKPPANIWNIPALLVVSPDNKLVYKVEGVRPAQFKTITAQLPAIIENQQKANEFWKKADEAKGETAAKLYDKGLSLLPRNVANERRDILDKAKKADPEDITGTRLKADFHHIQIVEKVNKMAREDKDIKGAEKFINEKLKIKGLSKDQTQKIMAARFSLAKQQNDKNGMLRQLEAITRVDPKSEMGRGAIYYYNYLTKPVIMKGNKITSKEMRPDFTPMVMNASPYVKTAGKYKIECKFLTGGCDLRNPRFMSGSRVIANTPADIKDKNAREFIIDVPSAPSRLQLVLDVKGHGWFSAEGEIIITKL